MRSASHSRAKVVRDPGSITKQPPACALTSFPMAGPDEEKKKKKSEKSTGDEGKTKKVKDPEKKEKKKDKEPKDDKVKKVLHVVRSVLSREWKDI